MVRAVTLPKLGTVAAFRAEARGLLARGVPPEALVWSVGAAPDLFTGAEVPEGAPRAPKLTQEALDTLETALLHRDPERFSRAYGLLWRLTDGLRWGDRSEPAMRKLLEQAKEVRRDIHKMHAFVRFRELPSHGNRRAFAAWFEPANPIVEAATPFFAKRFGDMDWAIATPSLTARCVAGALGFEETDPAFRPPPDATEELWRTYYAHIFNPARLMVKAMQSEMPKKYWHNLPEAELIPGLIRQAETRARAMQAAPPTEAPAHAQALARRASPTRSAETLATCTRCPLHATATQAVPGEGPLDAALMIVGEQPGDSEDLAGRPFVGPAGQVLRGALAEAGLDAGGVYLTNAVKHFKFAPRGKKRLHQSPTAGEIQHCHWWLAEEVRRIRPRLIVALGASAALSLTGSGAGIATRRGRIETTRFGPVLLTFHPAYLLRLPEGVDEARALFAADLARASELIRAPRVPPAPSGAPDA